MKKSNINKIKSNNIKKVTRSNFKNFIGRYKNILPVVAFAFSLIVFVGINLKLVPKLEDLPQTGEPISQAAASTFADNAQKFISSTEGIIFLIFFFLSLLSFLAYIAKSGFPRRK